MSTFATEPLVPNAWYIAGWPHELDDGPVARKILNEDLVLFRDGSGHAGAVEDRCPHRGVRLSLGTCVQNGLQCGYHGLVFDSAGTCVDNPGEALRPGVFDIRAFKVVEKQKFLWIWMGDQNMADESLIVDWPFHDMAPEWDFHFGRYPIAANYMFMMDNLMDLTHLGYVHTTTIGGNPEQHNKATIETTRTETGAHFIRWMLDSTPPKSFRDAGGFTGNVDRWSDFEYFAPASVLQWGGAMDVGKNAQADRRHQSLPGGAIAAQRRQQGQKQHDHRDYQREQQVLAVAQHIAGVENRLAENPAGRRGGLAAGTQIEGHHAAPPVMSRYASSRVRTTVTS